MPWMVWLYHTFQKEILGQGNVVLKAIHEVLGEKDVIVPHFGNERR